MKIFAICAPLWPGGTASSHAILGRKMPQVYTPKNDAYRNMSPNNAFRLKMGELARYKSFVYHDILWFVTPATPGWS